MSPATLTFPHPILTPIKGQPTNQSLQLLQKQIYANARAIHSTRGGGNHGHLALVMPGPQYLLRTGHVFVNPIHPGIAPVHGANATGPQITETNRQFAQDLQEHTLFTTVTEELKKQIILAVEPRYLSILEDIDFGFADISSRRMLAHLQAEYGQISNEQIEANRQQLSADWNPDDPIEDLWLRIQEAQRYAVAANEAITNATALRLTLPVFEKTGVFTTAAENWRDRPEAEWTMEAFKLHFTKANKERMRKLTAQGAGYHGANAAINPAPAPAPASPSAATNSTPAGQQAIVGNVAMYYCWTHGLGKNRAHTSQTCTNKAPGHMDHSTADNLLGGNDRIMRGGRRPPSGNQRQ